MKSGPKTYTGVTSYSVAPKRSFESAEKVFTIKPLPKGQKMKVLNRRVFDGAVKAAMRAKKSA